MMMMIIIIIIIIIIIDVKLVFFPSESVVKVDSKSRGVPFQGRLTSPGPFPLGITTI